MCVDFIMETPGDADKVISCLKNHDKNISKGCNKFSIESILGLKSPSDDVKKVNRLELMDFSEKGEPFCSFATSYVSHINDS